MAISSISLPVTKCYKFQTNNLQLHPWNVNDGRNIYIYIYMDNEKRFRITLTEKTNKYHKYQY